VPFSKTSAKTPESKTCKNVDPEIALENHSKKILKTSDKVASANKKCLVKLSRGSYCKEKSYGTDGID
jgi:hypothetical protein